MTMRIANWERHYETSESKRIKHLLWVATPNTHDSVGYRRLLKHPQGMAHYGAWNLILQTASKCSPRGLLAFGRAGRREDHTAETLADVTGGSESIIREAISRLLEIGWLEECPAESLQSAGQALPSAGHAQELSGQATSTGQGGQGPQGGKDTPAANAPPPPGKPGERTKATLRGLGLRATDDTVQEWNQLARSRAKCDDPESILGFIAWSVKRAKTDGIAVQFAREVAIYADEWAAKHRRTA